MSTLAVSPSTAAISLYFREGSSDKVYHAQIAPESNDLYSVNFQYGRRGSTLQTGTKHFQTAADNLKIEMRFAEAGRWPIRSRGKPV
jgi:predicted DNA-binding WGR domain protein